ncbi:ABC transporter substrate-binding protein [Sporolactobacillus pectinivorans]|uniref:ABC transporter substrate-binding protein n=1 Tax=Sporolactobacillus pectinivorans TaxID=1591408 RepID=UPI000C26A7E6|nr:ABC transporter substrate-binding protein [Sporolactobacillus pectinivorans]
MTLLDYYTELYIHLFHKAVHSEVEVSIRDISVLLVCSERYTKTVLRELETKKWISWKPGSGRGHKSKMSFNQSLNVLVPPILLKAIKTDHLEKVILFSKSHDLPEKLAKNCQALIKQQFGFLTEREDKLFLDVLRVPIARPLVTLDPAHAVGATEASLIHQIYEPLVLYNSKNRNFEPNIAHAWETSQDSKKWIFYLRKDVKFHHGKELTAGDVVYTFQRLSTSKSQLSCFWYLKSLVSVKAVNRYTVQLIFSETKTHLLHFIATIPLAILPSDVGFDSSNISGSGPFRVCSYDQNHLLLERFSNYFKERALLDKVEIYFTRSANHSRRDYVISGKFSEENFESHENGFRYLVFNQRKEGIQRNLYFREAFSAVIDRQKLVDDLGGDRYLPENRILIGSRQEHLNGSVGFEQVLGYLRKSGYHGEDLTLLCYRRDDAEWIKKRAQIVGINLKINCVSLSVLDEPSVLQQADILFGGEILENDLTFSLVNFFMKPHSISELFLNDDQNIYIKNVIKHFLVSDGLSSLRCFKKIEQYLIRNHLFCHLYNVRKKQLFQSVVSGINFDEYGWADFSKLWIKPESQ